MARGGAGTWLRPRHRHGFSECSHFYEPGPGSGPGRWEQHGAGRDGDPVQDCGCPRRELAEPGGTPQCLAPPLTLLWPPILLCTPHHSDPCFLYPVPIHSPLLLSLGKCQVLFGARGLCVV